MLYSTPASTKRQPGSVNSRLDFDATQAAANLIASQRTAAAPAGQRRADAGGVIPPENFAAVADVSSLNCLQAVDSSPVGGGRRLQRTATDHETDACPVEIALKCDAELARIAVGLRRSAELRVWLIILEHTRTTGFNYINRADLMALLERYGVKFTRHGLNRWLRAGQGTFWRLTTYGRVYLISYERLAIALTMEAATHDLPDLHDLVATNIPGMRPAMYIDVKSINLLQFEANCFAAWHSSKNNMPISRFTLQRLFNRDTKTMIAWQKAADITILHNFVHYTEEFSHDVPQNEDGGYRGGVIEYEVNKHKRWSAEYSNSYQTRAIRQHNTRGVMRRVFAKINEMIQSIEPASSIRQGVEAKRRRPGGLSRTGKYLFQDAKRARASAKHHGNDTSPRAIFKGIDNRRGGHYEHSPDGRERTQLKACFGAGAVLERVGRKTDKCMEVVSPMPF